MHGALAYNLWVERDAHCIALANSDDSPIWQRGDYLGSWANAGDDWCPDESRVNRVVDALHCQVDLEGVILVSKGVALNDGIDAPEWLLPTGRIVNLVAQHDQSGASAKHRKSACDCILDWLIETEDFAQLIDGR